LSFVTIKARATLRPIKGTDYTDALQTIFDAAAVHEAVTNKSRSLKRMNGNSLNVSNN